MSLMESSLQELKQLLSNTLSDNDHLKLSDIFSGISEDINNKTLIENDDIPDLITPPNTHRDNQSSEKSVVVESQKETMENKNDSNEHSNEDSVKPPFTDEYKSCIRLLNENDLFIYQSTNVLFSLLMFTEIVNLYYNFNNVGVSLLIFNYLMFVFYNSNKEIIIETQSGILQNSGKYFTKLLSLVKIKLSIFYSYFMDYFFSKNTQMILKFAYNVTRMKVITTYRHYRDQLFNPPLLIQTNKDNVYTVSFYLNGEKYKIPVVVPRFSFNKKQPPLMVLNKSEDDITQNILKYMGPNYDFYGMTLKPKHLNENSLNFMIEDGSEMTFLENDLMVL